MTGISTEREYLRDGRVTKMIIIELCDNRLLKLSYLFDFVILNICLFSLSIIYLFDPLLIFSGRFECALFGEYANQLQKMLGKSTGGMPVIGVQFAKVKIFRGEFYQFYHFVSFFDSPLLK
jgi:hypothetical protein